VFFTERGKLDFVTKQGLGGAMILNLFNFKIRDKRGFARNLEEILCVILLNFMLEYNM
jgi:hypothetical protein